MKRWAWLAGVLVAALAAACDRPTSEHALPAAGGFLVGSGIEVLPVAPGIWRHVSRSGDGIAANGLVVRRDQGLLLVDTGWSDEQTAILLRWGSKSFGKPWIGAVVTHHHRDRSGGLGALAASGVPVTALDRTAARLGDGAAGRVATTVRSGSALQSPLGYEAFDPGPGHAPDNLALWFPEQRLLFGGCLVRAGASGDLGNRADADLAAWPRAIRALAARYPEASIVVPGHGEPGGQELLAHTLALLAAPGAEAAPPS